MDIDGLGEKQVATLQEKGLVTTAADFYRLTPEQLVELEGYGELSAQRTVENIERSKEQGLERLLFAVGLEEVGEITGRNLAARFRSMQALMDASAESIEETPGIGTKMSEIIHDQLADPQMRELIDDLRGRASSWSSRARRRARARCRARRSC